MTWKHMKASESMRHVEQWVLRIGTAPACSLRRGETVGTWTASLLKVCGCVAVVCHYTAASLEQAQRDCEAELRRMGWEYGP